MTLKKQIEADLLQARFKKDELKRNLLTTLVGTIQTAEINARKELTDAEVVAVVKKFIDGEDFIMSKVHSELEAYKSAAAEKEMLMVYMPTQLSKSELTHIIIQHKAANPGISMGKMMGWLKTTFPGQYDGAMASEVVKNFI